MPYEKNEVHFVALQHGMWGSRDQMAYLEKTLVERWGDAIHVMNAKSNETNLTYDGIDICGTRLAREILAEYEFLSETFNVTKFSMIGYSQGGLTSRYAMGVLYTEGFFEKVVPVTFTTFASPHLGTRQPYSTHYSSIYNVMAPKILARTGEQITLSDGPVPLLLEMTRPSHPYIHALSLFRNRIAYANIVRDRTVPYWSSSFTGTDPFHDIDVLDITYDKNYSSLVTSYTKRSVPRKPATLMDRIAIEGVGCVILNFFRPILIPLWATFAISTMSIQSRRSRYRVGAMDPKFTRLEKLLDDVISYPIAEACDALPENIGVSPEEVKMLPLLEVQREASENLSKLTWKKYMIHCKASFSSHGAIIVRSPGYDTEYGRATVKHFVEGLEV